MSCPICEDTGGEGDLCPEHQEAIDFLCEAAAERGLTPMEYARSLQEFAATHERCDCGHDNCWVERPT